MTVNSNLSEPWKVTLVNTGINTMTGGRVKRIEPYIGNETFMLTYGDGVADIDINELLRFHRSHGKLVTLTSVQPEGRFGHLSISADDRVLGFEEKPKGDGNWVNGGYFVMEPGIFEYLNGDDTVLEKYPLERLAIEGELAAYKHTGFWYSMDTMRDKNYLDHIWQTGNAPWKVWR